MIGLQYDMLAAPAQVGAYVLRPYQRAADEAVDRELATHRSTLVVHATALGKTVLFCSQAAKRGGCLVLAHRDSLITQAAEKLELATSEPVHIEKAQLRAQFGARFIVASVQTLRGERLRKFALRFPDIEFIITDEAHRCTARSYRAIYEAFPSAKLLGVTATPDRSDGVGLKAVFETVAHEYNIIDGTADGWLTPLTFHPVQSDVDLSAVKVSRQSDGDTDFDQGDLDNAIVVEASKIAAAALKALDELGPGSRMIVFAPGVKTAHAGAMAANEARPGIACVVDGEMTDSEKRPIVAAFKAGEHRLAFNCAIFTEGYDDATLAAVMLAKPCASRMKFAQEIGRVTRVWPATVDGLETAEERRAAIAACPKPWAHVYDMVFSSAKHDVIVDGVDLLGGKDLPGPVSQAAKRILKERGGSVVDAIQEARDELRKKAAARRMAAAAKVLIGQPRSIFDRAGVNFLKKTHGMKPRPEDRATPKQLWKLGSRGIPIPRDCTKRMFARLLRLDTEREATGKCRLAGVEWLRAFGVDGWKMTSSQALKIKDAIVANGRRRLSQEQLAACMERSPGEDDE